MTIKISKRIGMALGFFAIVPLFVAAYKGVPGAEPAASLTLSALAATVGIFTDYLPRWSKLRLALLKLFERGLTKSLQAAEQDAPPQLSTLLETVLFCLSPVRRNDVLNDLGEWYPIWIKRVGPRKAKFIVWVRVADTLFHSVLDYAERVAGIIGKMKGAK